ncbi:hypothetical protein [Armatimonas rosea]|uniref:Uncharacterized protein n=1 Tax=Armatimonas rosea TaxID=685828 RepID=A0A7W9SWU4_ARMRO|nr:hypothetical protein [Armatimonas rosea]MBB6054126.1 hypothetical protein [Armatimonas rosea]
MIDPPPSILAANAETAGGGEATELHRSNHSAEDKALQLRAWSLRLEGKSLDAIARALKVTPSAAHRLLASSPGDLRRVSSVSLIIPGETVKVLGGYGDETGHAWVQGPRGRYSIPREFLEPVPAPEAPVPKPEAQVKPEKSAPLRRGNTEQHTPSTGEAENETAMRGRNSHAREIFEPKLTTGEVLGAESQASDGAPPLASPAQKLEPSERRLGPPTERLTRPTVAEAPKARPALTPADLSPEQRARWRQSLPTLESGSSDDDKDGASELRQTVGGQLVKTEDGREIIVAKDGTFRHAGIDAYRGLRGIAAAQTLQGRKTKASIIKDNAKMVTVTLIQPSRREAGDIRRSVVMQLIETHLDSEFQAVAHKLRATRAEKQLAERVIALRHVGMDHDGKEIRSRVGVTISEIRSV